MSALDDFPVNLAVDASFWLGLARLPGPAGQLHSKHGLPLYCVDTSLKGKMTGIIAFSNRGEMTKNMGYTLAIY